MIESPVRHKSVAKWTREGTIEATYEAIAGFLVARFEVELKSLGTELERIDDDPLGDVVEFSANCPDLESFRKQLSR
jgi:hypothetical protein